jgi:hypothetical protein
MTLSTRMVSSRWTSTMLATAIVVACAGPTDAGQQQGAAPAAEPQAAAQEAAAPAEPEQAEARPLKWSFGSQITYGIGFRMKDPDQRLIGRAAGGSAFSVNGDDGNQNYDKGVVQQRRQDLERVPVQLQELRRLRAWLCVLRRRERRAAIASARR